MKFNKGYSEIVCVLTGKQEQQAWTEETFEMLVERVKPSRRMLVGTLDEHCDSGSYSLKYNLLHYIVEELPKFGMLSFLHQYI